MSWKTTLTLLVLAGAGAACLWLLRPPAVSEQGKAPLPILASRLEKDAVERVALERGGEQVVLEKKADGTWTLAGLWPTQEKAVRDLVATLTGLESRFDPIDLGDSTDLRPYGLDPGQKPLAVVVEGGKEPVRLTLGEGEAPLAGSPYARPTFLRVGDEARVYRLQPGLLGRLSASSTAYERRRLFPHWERTRVRTLEDRPPIPGQPPPEPVERTLELLDAPVLMVQGPGYREFLGRVAGTVCLGTQGLLPVLPALLLPGQDPDWYVLEQRPDPPAAAPGRDTRAVSWEDVATGWRLTAPAADHLAARPLSNILQAVPDIWAERFTPPAELLEGMPTLLTAPLAGSLEGALGRLCLGAWQATRFGLAPPAYILSLRPPGSPEGAYRTLLVGAVVARESDVSQPLATFRYARLAGNERIFEIKADRLDQDVLVRLGRLRDGHVLRFETSQVSRVEVEREGEDVVLEKAEGQWRVTAPYRAEADGERVEELLRRLSGLQPAGPGPEGEMDSSAIFYIPCAVEGEGARRRYAPTGAAARAFGLAEPLATVRLTVAGGADGTPPGGGPGERELTLLLGEHRADQKQLYVWSPALPRVTVVADDLLGEATRPALAYRSRRVLDFALADLEKAAVERDGQAVVLERKGDGWRLSSPAAAEVDRERAEKLLGTLSSLEAEEFVSSTPTPGQLEKDYGLASPRASVTLSFKDPTRPARTLQVGKARSAERGHYARMADGEGVFVVKKEVEEALTQDPLALLPTKLWQTAVDDIASVRVRPEGKPAYELTRDNGSWKVSSPFQAPALDSLAGQMANDLAGPECAGYKALAAADLKAYGLDKPFLSVTVATQDGTEHELLLGGRTDPDGLLRYGKKKDSSAIFTISESLAGLADRGPLDLLDPVLLRVVMPAELVEVKSRRGEAVMTLRREGTGWQVLDVPPGPFAPDPLVLNDHQLLFAGLRAERYAAYGEQAGRELGKYGLEEPAAVLTVKVRPAPGAGKVEEHTVAVGKEAGEGGRYVRVDGRPGVAVVSADTAGRLLRGHLDFVDRDVLALSAGGVTGLKRTRGGQTLELARRDDAWRIVRPAEEEADEKTVQDLVGRLARLRAQRVAAHPAAELAPFGLEEPEAVLTIARGEEATVLHLGKPAGEGSDERFAQVKGGKTVFVLPGPIARQLLAAPLAFRDRSLARLRDADRMELERDRRKAVFARVAGTWKMIAPVAAPASQSDLDDFLNAVARLRADELVVEKPTPEQLKEYGLDRPEAHWKLFRSDSEVLDLVVGAAEKGGERRYARLGGGDLVFLLDPEVSRQVLAEYRTRAVWAPALDAAQIEQVRFGHPDSPFVLEKAGDAWRLAGMPGAEIDAGAVNETLGALARLQLVRYAQDRDADPKLYGLDPPALALEVTTPDGKRVLHLGGTEGSSRRRYARIPGPGASGVFVLAEADSGLLLRTLKDFRKE